jgi:flagellar basal-body rod modification protein FlgD
MIDSLIGKEISNASNYSNPSTSRDTSSQSQLEMQDFLQLLTSQITNQDPLEPMKDTEFISQMANIASLEQMQQFTDGFSNFAQSHNSMLAHSFLGKKVTLNDQGSEVSGFVKSVETDDEGSDKLVVDGKMYDPETVVKVSLKDS